MSKTKPPSKPDESTALARALKASTEIGVRADISLNDVIAITVSREEMTLKSQLAGIEADIKAARKDSAAKQKTFSQLVSEFAQSKVDAAPALAALKVLGFDKAKAEVTGSFNGDKGEILVTLHMTLERENRYGYESGQRSSTFVAPTTIRDLNKEIDTITERVAEFEARAISVRRSLADLPTLERQSRAAIAEAALSGSEKGQALLDTLGNVKSLRSLIGKGAVGSHEVVSES